MINFKSNTATKSTLISMRTVCEEDLSFWIPLYQRLYVWKSDNIKTLLEDLERAYLNNEEQYYLGGIMTIANGKIMELIDGQQRFTTLWLIAHELGEELSSFVSIKKEELRVPRLYFAVRDFANDYFSNQIRDGRSKEATDEELKNIIEGQKTIRHFFEAKLGLCNDRTEYAVFNKGFSKFIFEKVILVNNTIEREADETKVFEQMNNRGKQLEHHQILKSILLSKIKDDVKRGTMGMLWDACSIMDNYIEKNIKDIAALKWDALLNTTKELPVLEDLIPILNRREQSDNNITVTLLDILKMEKSWEAEEQKDENNEDDFGIVRSIISFPMLLLHTLRIYQKVYLKIEDSNLSAEVKEKKLLEIFNNQQNLEAEEFILLLWKIRVLFDKYIIKWIGSEDDNTEQHQIKRLYQSEKSFQRKAPQSNEGFALLQSMLYHSQQLTTHYWLTPLLHEMLVSKIQDFDYFHQYLERLDNEMFCNPRRDLRTMSYSMMNRSVLRGDSDYVEGELRSAAGTLFASYWFYKLEYILWLNRAELNKKERWEEYRMTAKNSVEHISPQNAKEDDENILTDPQLSIEENTKRNDNFGNLVLLTSSLNSEYSNKIYRVKREEFLAKKRIDALKSDLIFDNERWNWELSNKHLNQMIDLYKTYLLN